MSENTDRPVLTAPFITVTMDDGTDDKPATVHEVQTDNRDFLAWDMERSRRKWPGVEDAPFLWLTFIGWSALKRKGVLNGQPWESFSQHAMEVTTPTSEDVDPTQTGATPA